MQIKTSLFNGIFKHSFYFSYGLGVITALGHRTGFAVYSLNIIIGLGSISNAAPQLLRGHRLEVDNILLKENTLKKKYNILILDNKIFAFWFTKRAFYVPNLRAEKRIGPHSWEFYQFFVGLLLGDGHIGLSWRGAVIYITSTASNKLYLFSLQNFLVKHGYHYKPPEHLPVLTSKNPKKGGKRGNYMIDTVYRYKIHSYSFSSFIPLRHWWYTDKGVKIVPNNLDMYLTPFCLAIWFMGDGYYGGAGFLIKTQSFTYKEVSYLTGLLKRLYGLECTIRKASSPYNKGKVFKLDDRDTERGFIIYIRAKSAKKFQKLVTPYMSLDMLYKFGPSKNKT
jgi:LAGLIDADG DNA endonuclease family